MHLLDDTIAAVGPLDEDAMAQARRRQTQLTKPPGSLGRLETLSVQLAGITGRLRPDLRRRRIFVCAADHGVTAEGVSAYPAEVTRQMVLNFARGGAAINVLARGIGAEVTVADVGVHTDLPVDTPLVHTKVACGTGNIARGPAMTRAQAERAVTAGILLVHQAAAMGGLDLALTGDMGIGNTTASAAVVAAITGHTPADVTGRGTGVDDAQWQRKVAVVAQALAVNRPAPHDGLDVLAKVGGFEIGAIAGVILGAAARRLPVVLDGFIASAGALIAMRLCPQATAYMVAGHRSQEAGHRAALAHLGLTPLLDLDLRLGEGTGAALAVPLIEAAVRLLNEMATFAEAGVSDRPQG